MLRPILLLSLLVAVVAASLWMISQVDAAEDESITLSPLRGRAAFEWERGRERRPRVARAMPAIGEAPSLRAYVHDDAGMPLPFFRARIRLADPTRTRSSVPVNGRDGWLRYQGLEAGLYDLHVAARGHVTQRVQVEVPSAELLDLELLRSASVSGRVELPGGEVGARVAVTTDQGTEWVDTSATGRFEVPVLYPGVVVLRARLEGFGETEPLTIELAPGEHKSGLVLNLRGACQLTGELVPPVFPRAGRRVLIADEDGVPFTTTDCDPDGRFSVRLPPGRYRVMLDWRTDERGEDWVSAYAGRSEIDVELAQREARHVVLGVPPEQAIIVSGAVLDADEPAGESLVHVYEPGETTAVTLARTTKDGAFVLTLPEPGTYEFAVGPVGTVQKVLETEVDGTNALGLELVLPQGKFRGVVRAPDGTGVPHARLTLLDDGLVAREDDPLARRRTTTTNADGAFEIDHLPVGEYRLHVRGPGGDVHGELGTQVVTDLVLAKGDDTHTVEVVLEPGARILGTVVDEMGGPVVGAAVRVLDGSGIGLNAGPPSITDMRGGFQLSGVGSGLVRVVAESMGRTAVRELVTAPGGEHEVRLSL